MFDDGVGMLIEEKPADLQLMLQDALGADKNLPLLLRHVSDAGRKDFPDARLIHPEVEKIEGVDDDPLQILGHGIDRLDEYLRGFEHLPDVRFREQEFETNVSIEEPEQFCRIIPNSCTDVFIPVGEALDDARNAI